MGYSQSQLPPLQIGVKVGVSSSVLARNLQPMPYSPRVAPSGGVAFQYLVSPLLALSAEALYLQTGATNIGVSTSPVVSQNLAIHSVDIPVAVHFYPLGTNGLNAIPRVYAGHSVGLNFYARGRNFTQVGTINETPILVQSTLNATSSYSLLNLGIVTGAGVLFHSDAGTFSIDLTYRLGYSDVSNKLGISTTNSTIVMIGYWF